MTRHYPAMPIEIGFDEKYITLNGIVKLSRHDDAAFYDYLAAYPEISQGTSWFRALQEAATTGASEKTALQKLLPADRHLRGVEASHKLAEYDRPAVKELWPYFVDAGAKYDVPPAVLAGIASRESRCGALLEDGWGDGGQAFGIMQIDKGAHESIAQGDPKGLEHISQATEIFRDKLDQVCRKHPTWEESYQLHGAIAAYNMGASNVQTQAGIDIGTTHDDYGSDVLARAQYYLEQLGE